MKLSDLVGKYGVRFSFKDDNPPISYMVLNSKSGGLSYMSFVELSNGNISQFSKGDSIFERRVILDGCKEKRL